MAVKAFQLYGTVTVENKASAELKKVDRDIDHTKKNIGSLKGVLSGTLRVDTGSMSSMNSALGTLSNISNILSAFPAVGSILGGITGPAKDIAQLGLNFNALEENAKIAFSVMLKDGGKAEELLNRLKVFGKGSPIFNTKELITYAQGFLSIDGAGKELMETLKGIGTLTAITGRLDWMPEISLAFMQMGGKQKASMEEFTSQLGEKGLSHLSLELAGRATGKTADFVRKQIEAGNVSGKALKDLILEQANREYGSIVELMAQTRQGKEQQLYDSFEQLIARGTIGTHETLKGLYDRVIPMLNGPKAEALANKIGGVTGKIGTGLLGGFDSLMDGSLLKNFTDSGKQILGQGGKEGGEAYAQELEKSVKTGLKIQSPSLVGIEIGMAFGEGVNIGLARSLFQSPTNKFLSADQLKQKADQIINDPNFKSFVEALSSSKFEGSDFDIGYGGRKLDLSKGLGGVPRVKSAYGTPTSAFGIGQFQKGTWVEAAGALGFNQDDLSPANQLKAIAYLLQKRGALGDVLGGDFGAAIGRPGMPREWSSLPGGIHNRGGSVSDFLRAAGPLSATDPNLAKNLNASIGELEKDAARYQQTINEMFDRVNRLRASLGYKDISGEAPLTWDGTKVVRGHVPRDGYLPLPVPPGGRMDAQKKQVEDGLMKAEAAYISAIINNTRTQEELGKLYKQRQQAEQRAAALANGKNSTGLLGLMEQMATGQFESLNNMPVASANLPILATPWGKINEAMVANDLVKEIERLEAELKQLGNASELTADKLNKLGKGATPLSKEEQEERARRLFGAGAWQMPKKTLTKIGVADDFHGGLQNLLANVGWEKPGDLAKQFAVGLLRDIQARFAADLSALITGGIFGAKDQDGKLVSKGLGGGGFLSSIFSTILGSLFGGLFGGGGSWGKMGGKIGFPTPVKLARGMDYVPYDDFPALLHKGERVVPAEQNRRGGSVTIQRTTNYFNITMRPRQSFKQRRTQRETVERFAAFAQA